MYRVFLGPPTKTEIQNDPSTYSWRTFSPRTAFKSTNTRVLQPTQSFILPRATLEAARYRISLHYKHITFDDRPDEESFAFLEADEQDGNPGVWDATGVNSEASISISREQISLVSWPPTRPEDDTDISVVRGAAQTMSVFEPQFRPEGNVSISQREEQTTLISWPPTRPEASVEMSVNPGAENIDLISQPSEENMDFSAVQDGEHSTQPRDDDVDISIFKSTEHTTSIFWPPTRPGNNLEVSIFRGAAEQTTSNFWPPTRTGNNESRESFAAPSFFLDNSSKSIFELPSQEADTRAIESQPFETQGAESQSFGDVSDASSIARLPSFHFNLHSITPLTQLSGSKFKGSTKANVLLAVLEVDGPDVIRIKKGADAGKEVSILKIILGDEEGTVCKLTAWREVAEEWGGTGKAIAVKRGDIVYIENVMVACDPETTTALTASPYLKSQLVICYRTMPYTHEDGRLRPDLRLGSSEPSVRKVATIVQWFEQMAGLKFLNG